MRSIIKEYTLYSFDELSEDVKNRLIEREREIQVINYCDAWLCDDLKEKAKDLLQEHIGVSDEYLKVNYDLSYSQGSGVMVEFKIHIKDLNNKYKVFSDEEIDFLIDKNVIDYVTIKHNGSGYYHEFTFDIESDYYNYWNYDEVSEYYNFSEEEFNTIEDRFNKLIDSNYKFNPVSEFVKDIIDINVDLKNYGYEKIEYYNKCDDEEIINIIINSDMEYLENGEIYNG